MGRRRMTTGTRSSQKIDKQLESLSDEALLARRGRRRARTPAGARRGRPSEPRDDAHAGACIAAPRARRRRSASAIAVLAVPDARAASGSPAISRAVRRGDRRAASGASVWTWRHRAARAHVLSLLLVLWGLVLGAIEVLPRVGYAKPDPRTRRAGRCSAATRRAAPSACARAALTTAPMPSTTATASRRDQLHSDA